MNEEPVDAFRAAGVVVMTVVVVFALLGFGAWYFKDGKMLEDAVKLPLLVIAGLVSLIALLAVMAIAFKTVHLANPTQALGLPDGTVRAVIALSLILIFAVVTVYLFSDLSETDKVACQELADLKQKVDTAISHAPATPPPAATTTNPSPVPVSPEDGRRASKLAASQDFAKQLLIMLGTLITSITSFYFGSKTATDAPRSTSATPPAQRTGTRSGPSRTGGFNTEQTAEAAGDTQIEFLPTTMA
jgi:hypothetical protein